jgi:hypothetical protein
MRVDELRRATDRVPWVAEARLKRQALWAFVVLPGFMTLMLATLIVWLPVTIVFDLMVAGLTIVRERACDLWDRIARFQAYAEWRAS